ncbi:MAG: PQQ-binding-like beta-propeller repeat protein, partial [Planctomycetes bacterium]|nr:PQQ-binding-like beta-propeller repeat protein [Planctomycetota bacterium]
EDLPTGDAREVALRRLDELIKEPGGRTLLAPYEALATALLEEVEELDPQSIQAVLNRYPRTAAATRASDELLMLTINSGDVPTAASLVLDLLPESFSLGAGDPLHSSRVVALGLALRESGNERYLRGVLRRLSEVHSSDGAFLPMAYSVDLGELTEELLSVSPPETKRAPSFLSTARSRGDLGTRAGLDVEILGDIPPAMNGAKDPARVLLVGAREVESATGNGELTAYSADDLSHPLWKHRLRSEFVSVGWREEMRLFGPGYAAVASGRGIECVGRSDGITRWRWRPPEGEVYTLDAAEGMILVTCRLATRTFQVQALDEARGEPLWSFEYDSRSYHRTAVCGDSWLVLLPTGRLREAVILDAYTGRVAYTLDLGEPLSSRIAQGAWISEGKLVIPHLTARRDATSAELGVVDLSSGGPVWNITVSLPDGGESYLDACLRHDERTWLLVRPRGGDEAREAELFELHLGVGGAARVHGLSLGRNEVLLGVESGRTQALESTQVFVRSEEQGGATHRLRTHDL